MDQRSHKINFYKGPKISSIRMFLNVFSDNKQPLMEGTKKRRAFSEIAAPPCFTQKLASLII